MIYENHQFSLSGSSDPPNPFFAQLPGLASPPPQTKSVEPPPHNKEYAGCSTSDPDSESPSTCLRNSLSLRQSSASRLTGPFPPFQPGTPDVLAMFPQKGVLRVFGGLVSHLKLKRTRIGWTTPWRRDLIAKGVSSNKCFRYGWAASSCRP
jgi:hypothetical protein